MGDLTANISRHELACSCGCGGDTVDFQTIEMVQGACDHFAGKLGLDKVVLRITSAFRCLEWNRTPLANWGPGSTDGSQHPKGRAIDHSIDGVMPLDLYSYYVSRYPDRFGFGCYTSFVHADSRTNGTWRKGS